MVIDVQDHKEHQEKPLEYLVATLLDFFRDPKNEHRHFDAAAIALNQISRARSESMAKLERRYLFFASTLKNNLTSAAIRHFAIACFDAAKKTKQPSDNNSKIPSPKAMRKKALSEISQAISLGYSEQSAIHRAANELIKERKKVFTKKRVVEMISSHPLREAFLALNVSEQRLAKEDIRHHLLRLQRTTTAKNKSGVLFSLLERAKSFSASRLHSLLGDELFFLCRPVGFVDQNGSIVLIEVPTSAHLYALTYRKLEIISALKNDPNLRFIKKIQFKVTQNAF